MLRIILSVNRRQQNEDPGLLTADHCLLSTVCCPLQYYRRQSTTRGHRVFHHLSDAAARYGLRESPTQISRSQLQSAIPEPGCGEQASRSEKTKRRRAGCHLEVAQFRVDAYSGLAYA